ncbi:MAG: sulfatase-like hydrolase/transferase [Bacteroidota bacterium]
MNNILSKGFLFLLLLAIYSCDVNDQDQEASPNVIIILADDLGYADVGFNGCKDIPTPNIDRIADNGVRFSDAYVTYSVCGPSRAGLITGRYQDRFGFGRNPLVSPKDTLQGLPLSERTLADELKTAGYTSMAIGKWHLGTHKSQHPLKRGFDEFFGFLGGGHKYFPEQWTFNNLYEISSEGESYQTKLMRNNGRINEEEYITDAFSREAVDFIERKKDEPFFLYLAYNAPHVPLQATEKYLSRFDNINNKRRKTYAAMVSAMDDGIGLVLDKLKEQGIEENTIVFFLSDNGGPEKKNASDNGKLREGKKSLYEGGIRVPFAMQWLGNVPVGKVYEKPVISLDIFATALNYAKTTPANSIDGVDLVPYISDRDNNDPHENLYWRMYDYDAYAIRNGDNKLIRFKTENDRAYNLKKDIGEKNPLDTLNTKLYSDLKDEYLRWNDQLIDPIFLGLPQRKEYNRLYPDRFKKVKNVE